MSAQNAIARLVANGFATGQNAIINFVNMTQDGPVAILRLYLLLSMISTAGAFALKVNSPVLPLEGGDDVDLAMASMFQRAVFYPSSDLQAFSGTMAELRTMIAFFTRRDFLGTLVQSNTVQLNATGGAVKQFSVEMRIPVSLRDYMTDGDISIMGSHRFRSGNFEFQGVNLTPTVALTNGSAVISAATLESEVFFGVGEAGDVGATWRYIRTSGQPTLYVPPSDSLYLGGLDFTGPVATNANVYNRVFQREGPLNAPLLGALWQTDMVYSGGSYADITARCTPFDWIRNDQPLDDLVPRFTRRRIIDVSGPANLTLSEFHLYAPEPRHLQDMALRLGAGGPTHTAKLRARSMPIGSIPNPAFKNLLVTRVRAGVAPKSTATKSQANPTVAANQKRAENSASVRKNKLNAQLRR